MELSTASPKAEERTLPQICEPLSEGEIRLVSGGNCTGSTKPLKLECTVCNGSACGVHDYIKQECRPK